MSHEDEYEGRFSEGEEELPEDDPEKHRAQLVLEMAGRAPPGRT